MGLCQVELLHARLSTFCLQTQFLPSRELFGDDNFLAINVSEFVQT